MNYTVSVRPEVEADLEDAIAWYESRVFYLVHEGTIQILAVVHVKRHPSRWKNRSR